MLSLTLAHHTINLPSQSVEVVERRSVTETTTNGDVRTRGCVQESYYSSVKMMQKSSRRNGVWRNSESSLR
ncbi:hypothetical protein D3D01_15995 [Haloarcula sp. Atlit-7R]|nr:hypothetical protein D3D01_15995 [Haloarcula sp. Atlit-7R]